MLVRWRRCSCEAERETDEVSRGKNSDGLRRRKEEGREEKEARAVTGTHLLVGFSLERRGKAWTGSEAAPRSC